MRATRPRLDKPDIKDLIAYFCGRTFDRLSASDLGPMLDRMARYGRSRRCPVCGGVGRLDGSERMRTKSDEAQALDCTHRAHVVADMKDLRVRAKRIPHLVAYRVLMDRASVARDRWTAYREAEAYRLEHANRIADEAVVEARALGDEELDALRVEIANLSRDSKAVVTEWCGACHGRGWIPSPLERLRPLDANITGSSKHGSTGIGMGESEAEQIGRVDSRLLRIRSGSDRGYLRVAVLSRLYGPGACGVAGLLALTTTGKRLVNQHAKEYSDAPSPDAVLDRVRERQQNNPDIRTGSLLTDARHEAEDLRDESVEAWLAEVGPRKARRDGPAPRRARIKAPPDAEKEVLLAEIIGLSRVAMDSSEELREKVRLALGGC